MDDTQMSWENRLALKHAAELRERAALACSSGHHATARRLMDAAASIERAARGAL